MTTLSSVDEGLSLRYRNEEAREAFRRAIDFTTLQRRPAHGYRKQNNGAVTINFDRETRRHCTSSRSLRLI